MPKHNLKPLFTQHRDEAGRAVITAAHDVTYEDLCQDPAVLMAMQAADVLVDSKTNRVIDLKATFGFPVYTPWPGGWIITPVLLRGEVRPLPEAAS
jgi:hypothetical protein